MQVCLRVESGDQFFLFSFLFLMIFAGFSLEHYILPKTVDNTSSLVLLTSLAAKK
jgi:hypothetical protein